LRDKRDRRDRQDERDIQIPPVSVVPFTPPVPVVPFVPDVPFVSPVPNHYHEYVDCCLDGGTTATEFRWTTRLTDWLLLGRKAIDNPGTEVRMA
jgi:hypothetical protein